MKTIQILIVLFFAATLGASAQGPAKRTMPKRNKAEIVEAKGEVTEGAEAAAEGAAAAVTPPVRKAKTPPKAAPAAPVNTPRAAEKPAAAKPAAAKPAAPAGNRPAPGNRPGAAQQAKPAAGSGSIREFPTAATMPDDAAWRREVYRTLDLTKEENAVLYFPITPSGGRQNLFCFLFRQILAGKIKAYEYTLDANEHFDEAHQIKGKKIMDTHNIYYEEYEDNGKKKIRLNDSDLPSEDVKLYFIKECLYYDQHSASFRTKITALCPVMVSGTNDFGEDEQTRVPLFWVNYEDAAPFLAKLSLMGSSMNNAAVISADDYFTMNRYKGDIYKTTNLQDRIIAQYAETEEAQLAERKRIEGELGGFEERVWGHKNERLIDVYGNPVLDNEGKGIRYDDAGKLVDGRGRRIAFVVAGKDSVNVVSDEPEVDPLPSIVFVNERGFAVDEAGQPLLKADGSPVEITDEYPAPEALADGKKKSSSSRGATSSAPSRRGGGSDAPSRRSAAGSSSSKSSSGKSSSTSKSKSTASKSKGSKAPKPAKASARPSSSKGGGGMSVRRERH